MDLPAGTRNYSYADDMTIFRTRTQKLMLVGLFIMLLAIPLWMNRTWLGLVNLMGITIIAATGLNILTGYCGQLSIGHAGFIAVGAYTSAVLTSRLEMPFLVGLLGGGVLAGLVGVIFGIPSLRVKGFYLAISTIAAFFIIIWVITHWDSVTGGFMGMSVPLASIGPIVFKSEESQFFLIMGITVLCIFFAKNLARTRVGRAFVAIRDNDLAAEVMGINLFRYKLTAFFIGCFMAGIAGSLRAHYTGFLSYEFFTLTDSILFIGIIIIGGLGTTLGPILGVVFIKLLDHLLTHWLVPLIEGKHILPAGFASGITPMVFGLAIILFLILEPRGIAHRWQLFKASYRLWPFSY
ncbi:MAG TPA: branched-chain amino acid ABC transporter permease [Dehalococcoidales bacterium]